MCYNSIICTQFKQDCYKPFIFLFMYVENNREYFPVTLLDNLFILGVIKRKFKLRLSLLSNDIVLSILIRDTNKFVLISGVWILLYRIYLENNDLWATAKNGYCISNYNISYK